MSAYQRVSAAVGDTAVLRAPFDAAALPPARWAALRRALGLPPAAAGQSNEGAYSLARSIVTMHEDIQARAQRLQASMAAANDDIGKAAGKLSDTRDQMRADREKAQRLEGGSAQRVATAVALVALAALAFAAVRRDMRGPCLGAAVRLSVGLPVLGASAMALLYV